MGGVMSIGGQGSVRGDRGQRRDAGSPPIGMLLAERWAPIDFDGGVGIGQQFPQEQPQPDFVAPHPAVIAA
jgi:hypothetical protein